MYQAPTTCNTPKVHPFWQEYTDLTARSYGYKQDISKAPKGDAATKVIYNILTLPTEKQADFVKLVCKYLPISNAGFRSLASVFGKINVEDEIPTLEIITSKKNFSNLDAYEIRERASKFKTPGLKDAVEKYGLDITRDQLRTAISSVKRQSKTIQAVSR